MWAELAFWAGPNWIQKTQKMTFFTSWEVLIRPKSIHEMTNSAQRYYIQKVHEKCYLTPPYVFFISVVVLDLDPCQFSQSKPPIFVKIGVWAKSRSAHYTFFVFERWSSHRHGTCWFRKRLENCRWSFCYATWMGFRIQQQRNQLRDVLPPPRKRHFQQSHFKKISHSKRKILLWHVL